MKSQYNSLLDSLVGLVYSIADVSFFKSEKWSKSVCKSCFVDNSLLESFFDESRNRCMDEPNLFEAMFQYEQNDQVIYFQRMSCFLNDCGMRFESFLCVFQSCILLHKRNSQCPIEKDTSDCERLHQCISYFVISFCDVDNISRFSEKIENFDEIFNNLIDDVSELIGNNNLRRWKYNVFDNDNGLDWDD